MKNKLEIFLSKINLCKVLACHLYGDKHTYFHRIIIGLIVAALGVLLTKIQTGNAIFQSGLDFTGYAFHGAGVLPCIEWFASLAKETAEEA